jgi:hypothetical protein
LCHRGACHHSCSLVEPSQVMTCVTEVLAITAVPWLNLLKS